jgi:hypothetical protein
MISSHLQVEISLTVDSSEYVQWGYVFIKILSRKCVAVYLATVGRMGNAWVSFVFPASDLN